MRVSINLSVVQLRDDAQLVERLRASLAAHDVNAGSLELEITETVLMESVDRYLGVVNEIRALGVKLSLDDFGTGYSSLSYLPRFPLDRLKIDRAFVNGRLTRPPISRSSARSSGSDMNWDCAWSPKAWSRNTKPVRCAALVATSCKAFCMRSRCRTTRCRSDTGTRRDLHGRGGLDD
jgi:predicted signal transduction protein with EAL and GGDEF domain